MRDTAAGYGWMSIGLHWLASAAVAALLGLGLGTDALPDGPERAERVALHVGLGALAALPLLLLVGWRLARGFPAPLEGSRWQRALAVAVHYALLAAIAVMATTGPLIAWSGGGAIDVFGIASLPSPFGRQDGLRAVLMPVHAVTAKAILVLLAVHLAGVMKHVMVDHVPAFRMAAPPAGPPRGGAD